MRLLIAAAALLATAACSTTPLYQKADVLGAEGYADQQLDEYRYQVSFTGDAATTADTVRDFALLRASELTLRAEADWFEVISESPVAQEVPEAVLDLADTGPGISKECGVLGCRDVLETNRPFGSGDPSGRTKRVFAHSMEIQVHTGQVPAGRPNAYDAKATSIEIWDRYNLLP